MALTDNPNAQERKNAQEQNRGTPDSRATSPERNSRGRYKLPGGDKGGRRPSMRPFKTLLNLGSEIQWVRKTAGKGRISQFVSAVLAAAEALGLTRADWERVKRDPGRFRDALRRELDKTE